MSGGRLAVAALLSAAVLASALFVLSARFHPRTARSALPLEPVVTAQRDSARIVVEVFNATTVPGLARAAMMHLRDRGFDVVRIGTSTPRRDSTLVIDRTHHPAWARHVARALDGARTLSRPDSSRYVDVSVFLGTTWHPSGKAFHP